MTNTLTVPFSATSYLNATGSIDYGMTNDYMFRAVLQENNYVLKGLICSLLHLNPCDVISVEITNPIELGKTPADDKEFILRVVNLKQIGLATDEDKSIHLDYWARLFTAKSRDYHDYKKQFLSFLSFAILI